MLAHEYAHNLQQEFGVFTLRPSASAKPFELQADCLAGAWGNSVYRQGLLEPGDVEEAINTALAVGDFDVGNAQHHGTPEERREAWLLGFEGGPGFCRPREGSANGRWGGPSRFGDVFGRGPGGTQSLYHCTGALIVAADRLPIADNRSVPPCRSTAPISVRTSSSSGKNVRSSAGAGTRPPRSRRCRACSR